MPTPREELAAIQNDTQGLMNRVEITCHGAGNVTYHYPNMALELYRLNGSVRRLAAVFQELLLVKGAVMGLEKAKDLARQALQFHVPIHPVCYELAKVVLSLPDPPPES